MKAMICYTITAFLIGHQIGILYKAPSFCQPKDFWKKLQLYESTSKDQTMDKNPFIFDTTFVHSNTGAKDAVLQTVFSMIHHASCPVETELILTSRSSWGSSPHFTTCDYMYATRSPVRMDQDNRCLAVVRVDNKFDQYSSYTDVGHRTGIMTWPQKLTNQYQDDIIHRYSFKEEKEFTSLFLRERQNILDSFLAMAGDPIGSNGQRRTLILMIANEGVMDLLLNLLCSAAKVPTVDLQDFIIFVGQPEYIPVVESMGARGFYHPGLSEIPKNAAANYADRTFAKIMWLKVTAVYITVATGFNALFQDVDLVWMRNPIPYLLALEEYDVIFMDDGARTPRFAPYFTNTGFYLMRYNDRTKYLLERLSRAVGEISYTASHQATLIRHLTESIALVDLKIKVLPDDLFPSGRMFHEQKGFVEDVKRHMKLPYVWHMCWTDNRDQKVAYYRVLGLWFPPDDAPDGLGNMCINGPKMLEYASDASRDTSNTPLGTVCCTPGGYWAGYEK